jgi:triosephosphate isomerase
MRKQIAAANWKMNLSLQEAQQLTDDLLATDHHVHEDQQVILAVPYPYLLTVQQKIKGKKGISLSAQNCAATKNGAYTGEVSAEMLHGLDIKYALVGHSERREYYCENNQVLGEKVNRAFESGLNPIFCCGEPFQIRDAGTQNSYVENQLKESLFHLFKNQLTNFIIAYEPIWAIGTGKTASSDQAQEMHAHIRDVMARQFGNAVADTISILYGGSVKASNAAELFSKPDVDGGLVGGASLNAAEFCTIINSLKKG